MELYLRVRLAVSEGITQRQAAKHFNISRDSVAKMLAHSTPPGYQRRTPIRRPKRDAFVSTIDHWLEADMEMPRKQRHTAKRVFDRLRDECGFTGGYTIIEDYMRERDQRRQPGRLVFIDETSINTKMPRLRGRARRGQRLKASAPFGKWGTQTLIAGLRHEGLTAPWVIHGAMNRAAFNICVETQLAPTLAPGDLVNLSVHKSARAQAATRAQGAWMLFLPQFSPDLNPIEMAFSKLKPHLRKAGARDFDTLSTSALRLS